MNRPFNFRQFQNDIDHLLQLGPRPTFEFFIEFGTRHGVLTEIIADLQEWRSLDPDTVKSVGGDQFPRPVLRLVPRS
jgi:hypothetical protein